MQQLGSIFLNSRARHCLPLTSLGFALCLGFLAVAPVQAFPPAPNHTFYGMVRDEMGNPLMITNAVVILETVQGVQIKATVVPSLGPGVNYRLSVPMDAGLTMDNYRSNALRAAVNFRMKVKIGNVTYLPMETAVQLAALGRPAKSTRMDLTCGEDLDGDGLPDAWERALIAMLGLDQTIQDIRPEDDTDGDGMTNMAEYLAGTYAFDPADGLRLDLLGFNQGRPLIQFLVIPGRVYTIQSSEDLTHWTPVQFRCSGDVAGTAARSSYSASEVQFLSIEVVGDDTAQAGKRMFRAMVQ